MVVVTVRHHHDDEDDHAHDELHRVHLPKEHEREEQLLRVGMALELG